MCDTRAAHREPAARLKRRKVNLVQNQIENVGINLWGWGENTIDEEGNGKKKKGTCNFKQNTDISQNVHFVLKFQPICQNLHYFYLSTSTTAQ
jgi:hypothetical protein